MTTQPEKIDVSHRIMFAVIALLGGAFAAALIGAAVMAQKKLNDPTSLPAGTLDNPPDELRLLTIVGFGLGGFVGLIAFFAALGIFVGPAKTEPYDPRGAPIDPTLLLGEEKQFRRPNRYVAPEDAQKQALACGALLLVLVAGSVASWWMWRVPVLIYLFAAGILVLGVQWLVYVVGVELAARRLHVRFSQVPRQARPGEAVEVEVELRPQGPLAVDVVQIVLAGLLETEVREGKSTVHVVEVLHRELRRLPLDGEKTKEVRRFRCALTVPQKVAPSGKTPRGSVRWIVAAMVDIPDWPDAARVCELDVKA